MWHIFDIRTGRRASHAVFLTREGAEEALDILCRRIRRGERLDLIETVFYLNVRCVGPSC